MLPEFSHPAYPEIRLAAKRASGIRGSLLEDLFSLSLANPDEWIHWTKIRDTTFRDVKREKTTNSDNVAKLGKDLLAFLKDYIADGWEIKLLTQIEKPPGKSRLWKLVVKQSEEHAHGINQTSSIPTVSKAPEFFVPEFNWHVNDYKRRMPVWLPFDPKLALNFIVNVCSEWPIPSEFADYEMFKAKRWKEKAIVEKNVDPYDALVDTPICCFKSHRVLVSHNSILPVEIDASWARYSDYRATNEQVIEWLAKGHFRQVKEFKTKLCSTIENEQFFPNAANPISVIVNLFTEDNKIIFIQNQKNGRWDSPAGGFLDPLQDFQRVSPFCLSPQETVIRMVYKHLGVPVHRQPIRWNALARHRENGAVALLGEMNIGLKAKEAELFFLKRRLKNQPPLSFVDFSPAAILDFFSSCDSWPLNFLEISVALSLRHRFIDVTVAV